MTDMILESIGRDFEAVLIDNITSIVLDPNSRLDYGPPPNIELLDNFFTDADQSGGGCDWSANQSTPCLDLLLDPYPTNSSAVDAAELTDRQYNFWTLLLLFFPVLTVFGNVLVVLSVYNERSLQTVTNYFIVSLAIADIMVAILVMPLAVYVEVNNSMWMLGDALCDTWVALDVMCCTASILNLAAISVDRFFAVTQPIKYAKHKNSNRVYFMLGLTWVVSICISSPIALGMNYTERRSQTPFLCTFYNSDFLIYSSMGSFYIPCIVMVLLYWRIFHAIRMRARKSAAQKGFRPATASGCSGEGGTCAAATAANDAASTTKPPSDPIQTKQRKPEIDGCCPENVATHNLDKLANNKTADGQNDRLLKGKIQDCVVTKETSFNSATWNDEKESCPRAGNNVGKTFANNLIHSSSIDRTPEYRIFQQPVVPTYMTIDVVIENPSTEHRNSHAPARAKEQHGQNSHNQKGGQSGQLFANHALTVVNSDNEISTAANSPAFERKNKSPDGNSVCRCSSNHGSAADKRKKKFRLHFRRKSNNRKKNERKSQSAHRRERKATKTLAIVLGVFLLCWVPFFTINIINAICIRYDLFQMTSVCQFDPILFSFSVWLGYMNSFLNPVIYTIFNIEFRRAFTKLLQSVCKKRR